jgi:hypothetical protein
MTQNGPLPGQPSQPWQAGGPDQSYQEPADPWGEQNDAWGGNPTSTPPGAAGSPTDYGVTGPQDQGYGGGYAPHPYDASLPAPTGTQPGIPTGLPGGVPPQFPTSPTGLSATGLSPTGVAPGGFAPMWAPMPPKRRGPGKVIVLLVVVLGLLICGGLGTLGWLIGQKQDNPNARDTVVPTATTVRPTAAGNDVNPGPQSSQDARFVAKGQCVRNEGTADAPKMTISVCASGTYEVLARVQGRTTGEADAETKCAKVRHYTKWYFYDSELDDLDFVLCLRER